MLKKIPLPFCLVALVAGAYLGWCLLLHVFFYEATVLRSVGLNKWQCIDCTYTDANKMQLVTMRKIAFQANYNVYRRPKGIGKLPDGGMPLYLRSEVKPFLLDVQTGQLTEMHQALPWQQGYNVFEPYIKKLPSPMIEALNAEQEVGEVAWNASPLVVITDPQTQRTTTITVEQLGFTWPVLNFPLPGFNGLEQMR
jgi:hypothetical protein